MGLKSISVDVSAAATADYNDDDASSVTVDSVDVAEAAVSVIASRMSRGVYKYLANIPETK